MAKPKFASLTAGLLARKGEAHPAADSFAAMAAVTPFSGAGLVREPADQKPRELTLQDELEWMTTFGPAFEPSVYPAPDRGVDPAPTRAVELPRLHPAPALEPQTASVEALLKRIGKPAKPHHTKGHEETHTQGRRVAVTVRLDEPRYLRLKLTGLRFHRTSQDLVTTALDAYLTALGIEPVTEADLKALRISPVKPSN